MPSALIIDDSAVFRASARLLLEADGFDADEAATGSAGVAAATDRGYDLVLLDVQLPDLDGFEVARRLGRLDSSPAVVLISSRDRHDYGSLVRESTARGFIPKSELSAAAIRALLEQPT